MGHQLYNAFASLVSGSSLRYQEILKFGKPSGDDLDAWVADPVAPEV